MYPDNELTRLAGYKNVLQRRIQSRREECAEAYEAAVRPLEWLDRAIAWWRKVSPLAKVTAIPLAFILKKTVFRRTKILGTLFRWGPIAFQVFRSFRRAT